MHDELRGELLRRAQEHQAARTALLGVAQDEAAMAAVRAVDAGNVAWLRQVMAEHGWPGRSLVGADGAQAAWLLAQQANADPVFQRECLDRLAAATTAGEATQPQLAYLTDRVLLAEGGKQVYGTQAVPHGGRYEAAALRDPETVDERRAAVSLGPLADYLDQVNASYGPPQATLECRGCGAPVRFPLAGEEEQQVTCAQCGWTASVRSPAAL